MLDSIIPKNDGSMADLYAKAIQPAVVLKYDYDQVPDAAEREILRSAAIRIREVMDNARWVVGSQLIQVKDQVGHGVWLDWLRGEWDLSERAAQMYMNTARLIENGGAEYAALGSTAQALLGAQDPVLLAEVGPALLEKEAAGEGSGRGGSVNVEDVKRAVNRAAGRQVYVTDPPAPKAAPPAPVSRPAQVTPTPTAPVYVAPTPVVVDAPAWPPPADLAAILVPAHVLHALADAVAGGVLVGFLSDAQADLLEMAINDALMTLDARGGA